MLGMPSAYAITVTPAKMHPSEMGFRKAGAMSKSGHSLARLFHNYRAHIAKGAKTPFKPRSRFLQFANGRILVDARAATSGDALLKDLHRLGYKMRPVLVR